MTKITSSIHLRAVLRLTLVYAPLLFLLGVAQCSFFTRLTPLPAVPDLVLAAVAAIAIFESQGTAVVCSIGAGFMIDALGSSGISLSPIFLLLVAILSSEISKKLIPSFLTWPLVLLPAALLKSLFTLLNVLLITDSLAIGKIFLSILLPELIVTVIVSLPIFFIAKLCASLSKPKNKFKLNK